MTTKDTYLQQVLTGKEYLLFDGAMGTMLQAAGLEIGGIPELLAINDPSLIQGIHEQYVAAGSQVVTANTFGANAYKLEGKAEVSQIFEAAIGCAKKSGARYVAADIGPIGALLAPLGTLDFEEAYDLFKEQVLAAQTYGADIILIETMSDLAETKAAILAAKENTTLPIFATMTFEEDGRTFLGTSPRVAAITLEALGVSALGINCSLQPAQLLPFVSEMLSHASCPIMVQANAGLPEAATSAQASYATTPESYACDVAKMLDKGVSIVGGCCGTDPDYIRHIAQIVQDQKGLARQTNRFFSVTSAQNAVVLNSNEHHLAVVGERINPTGKPRLKEALREENYGYVIEEALTQQEHGADILDVNVGLPEIDEPAVLVRTIQKLQEITPLPLQIDSADPVAVEAAARMYVGKPLINSVNGKKESLETIIPLAAKYGCALVGLTLDENGIPKTAEERLAIARTIVEHAQSYGVPKHDIVIDCLTMAAATNPSDIAEILQAITLVKKELGVKTMLGVSNVSFGLPEREIVNTTFLSAALGVGLDMPILNPLSLRYRDAIASFKVLNAQDEGAAGYIAYVQNRESEPTVSTPSKATGSTSAGIFVAGDTQNVTSGTSLEDQTRLCIETGRKAQMREITTKLLETHSALEIIDQIYIPALNTVGEKFEAGEFFLPQLMMSSEAVKQGFDVLKEQVSGHTVEEKGKICLATVKGDVHDIGKNIVKMLLENHGYRMYDLGRDVDPEIVVETVKKYNIPLVGLSALMTTTVRSMEETIQLLRKEVPECTVFVGGAVLTPEYAELVGADHYSKDAASAARFAGEFFAG